MGCGACFPCLLRPPSGVGSEGSCLDPANQNSPPPCLPHRPSAAASGKTGLWPADPRRRGPFSFLGAGVLWVPGLGRGKMEILEKPGHHFSDAISAVQVSGTRVSP